jgi:hypothetical protein
MMKKKCLIDLEDGRSLGKAFDEATKLVLRAKMGAGRCGYFELLHNLTSFSHPQRYCIAPRCRMAVIAVHHAISRNLRKSSEAGEIVLTK